MYSNKPYPHITNESLSAPITAVLLDIEGIERCA